MKNLSKYNLWESGSSFYYACEFPCGRKVLAMPLLANFKGPTLILLNKGYTDGDIILSENFYVTKAWLLPG